MPPTTTDRPHFAIIGAMKCGTTSLFDFLTSHPDVCAPRNKEPHYFTRGYRMPAAYYRRLFRECGDEQIFWLPVLHAAEKWNGNIIVTSCNIPVTREATHFVIPFRCIK